MIRSVGRVVIKPPFVKEVARSAGRFSFLLLPPAGLPDGDTFDGKSIQNQWHVSFANNLYGSTLG